VAETKGSADAEDLRADEQQRIASAAAYFRDVGTEVRFEKVSDYDELRQIIS
jgi:restriction endonuclease